jgi:hypothetical protein
VIDDFERQRLAEQSVRTTIYSHAHMDEDTFDCSRAMLCPDLVPAEPGRWIPACTYNLFYRMRDERFFTKPRPVVAPCGATFPELITIEDDVFFGMGAKVFTHEFRIDQFRAGEVTIRREALIGGFATIRCGVEIGERGVVAACSVADRDVPPGATLIQSPARIIRRRENGHLPVAAFVLLGISLVLLRPPKQDGTLWSKVLFASGIGAMGFSFFRLFLLHCCRDNLVWFGAWEEVTKLLFILGVALVLWTFRRALLAELRHHAPRPR